MKQFRPVCLALLSMGFVSPAFALGVTVVPAIGHPQIATKVGGNGFAANEAVDIYFDTTDEVLTVSDGSGAFSNVPMTVPASSTPGTHWITAIGRKDGVAAQKSFSVRTDWPEVGFSPRGKRENPYENVLTTGNVTSLEVAWTATTGQYVNASPAVVNGRVYIASNDHKVHAFNATTGAELWSTLLGDYSNSSPAVAAGRLYVGANDGRVYAINANTGARLWTRLTGGPIEGSPTVANGIVYVGSDDGNLYAFNAATGAKVWSTGAGNKITVTPAVANGVVYVDTASTFSAYDAATGALLFGSGGVPFYASPAVANGKVFVGINGDLGAFDAANGHLLWGQSIGGTITAPAVANGIVYVGSTDGSLWALSATNGSTKWIVNLAHAITASPAYANGVLYVAANLNASENELYAVDPATGSPLWGAPMAGGIQSSPTVVNGMVYFGSDDFKLYAFALDGGSNPVYRQNRTPPSYATLHPDLRLKPFALH